MNTRARKRTSSRAGNERAADPPARRDVDVVGVDVVGMAKAHIAARDAEHRSRIAAAAYYRAMQRGFEPGHELEDWLAAEAEIANTLLLTE